MGPISLARWQWQDYHEVHADRRNLRIHLVAVPLFLLGNLLTLLALAWSAWLTFALGADILQDIPYMLAMLGIALAGVGISAGAIAWQGKAHKLESKAPKPFTGAGNAIGRILVEQWFTFPRFVLSGGWRTQRRRASKP